MLRSHKLSTFDFGIRELRGQSGGVNIRLTTEDLDYGDEKEGADVADEPVTQRDGTEYPRHKEDDASSSKHDGRNL